MTKWRRIVTGQLKVMWDLDGTLADYERQKNKYQTLYPHVPFVQCLSGFFLTMPVISKALACFNALERFPGVDNYILTAPSNKNPLSYTEKRLWVQEHLGDNAVENLILASNKSLILGDVLVDDMKGHGQEDFRGKFILINKDTDWQQICAKIIALAQIKTS